VEFEIAINSFFEEPATEAADAHAAADQPGQLEWSYCQPVLADICRQKDAAEAAGV